jgi:serine/threonine protein kinase/Tol biopolymer transport system component
MDLPTGAALGQYVIDAELGRGGMAVVYRAHHRTLGSVHALKVLQVESPAIAARLLEEGRTQAALRHPNAVAVTDAITADGRLALVIEYVDGPTLEALLAHRRPTLAQADGLARGILAGVAAAHAQGRVHRDLKPGNVLLAIVDGTVVPKIADFGLAKVLDADAGTAATRSGMAMGTPPYMAPEQIRDASRADARADVFSAGAILYELVTGRRAFDGPDAWSIFQKIHAGDHAPLPPELPTGMAGTIARALAVDREERYPNAAALLAAWTGGTPLADDAWSAADLEAVRELAPSRTRPSRPPSRPGPTPSPTFEVASAPERQTWTEEQPVGPPPAPIPSPSRAPWVVAVAVLAIGAVAAAVRGIDPSPAAPAAPIHRQLTFESALLTSPTLSPDGGTVVYVEEGELYARRIGGDRAVLLTEDVDGAAEGPAFSPDGTRLAFVVAGVGTFVMGASGDSPRRVADETGSVGWSPDGGSLVVVGGDHPVGPLLVSLGGDAAIVDLTSGAHRVPAPDHEVFGAAWSPDGRWLIAWDDARDLVAIPVAGGAPIPVLSEAAFAWNPRWSPDGRAVWFLSDRGGTADLWALGFDSANGRPVGAPEPLTRGLLGSVASFAASADGRRVVLASLDTTSVLWRATLGSDGVLPPPSEVLRSARVLGSAAPSPDGALFAFDTLGTVEDVFVVAADGHGVRRLTDHPTRDGCPVFRADGRALEFVSRREGAGQQVYEMGLDGGGVVRRDDLGVTDDCPGESPLGWVLVRDAGRSTDLVGLDGARIRTVDHFVSDWTADGTIEFVDDATVAVLPDGRRVPLPCLFGGQWLADGRVICLSDSARHGPADAIVVGRPGEPFDPWFDLAPAAVAIPPGSGVTRSADGRSVAILGAEQTSNLWTVDLPAEAP